MSVALVTGASSGIGAALARRLHAGGWEVAVTGRRLERLVEVPAARRWLVDFADLDAVDRLAAEVGPVDLLVNNAGTPKRRAALDLTPAEVESTMAVNFFAPARLTLALLPGMLERGSGTVVNVGSVGGRVGIAHEAAYVASKFALTGWSEALAIDLHGTGVRVKLVQPGPVDTDIWDRPGEDPASYDGPLEPPDVVADGIVEALGTDRFEHFLPDLSGVVAFKNGDVDGWIRANAEALP